jgi:hypothetical protein
MFLSYEGRAHWWLYPKQMENTEKLLKPLIAAGLDRVVRVAGDLLGAKDPIIYGLGYGVIGNQKEWNVWHIDGFGEQHVEGHNQYHNKKSQKITYKDTLRKIDKGVIIIPLELRDNSPPELFLLREDVQEPTAIQLRYEVNHAYIIPEDSLHRTAACEGSWEPPDHLRVSLYLSVGPGWEAEKEWSNVERASAYQINNPFYPWWTDGEERPFGKEMDDWISLWHERYMSLVIR